MIGFEVFAVTFDFDVLITGVLSIGLAFGTFCGRLYSCFALQRRQEFSNGIVPIMTWGGLKGGFPLLLPYPCLIANGNYILAATYVVVIFSIIVQGLTIAPLAKRLGREPDHYKSEMRLTAGMR